MITVLCYEKPKTDHITGVMSLTRREPGQAVELCLADAVWTLYALGEITAIRPDTKWPNAWRFDVRIVE